MQTQQTITLSSKNGPQLQRLQSRYHPDRNLQAFHYNVVAFGKQGHFAKPLQNGPASSYSSRHNLSQTTSPPSPPGTSTFSGQPKH